MAVQTFNPTDLSESAANWAVAQRIVGPFAPHAQVTPNLTLALDPGHLLSGTTLTEVNAQNVGPFVPPASGFRIDRVVIDRATGAASIVTGAANSLTPPAIPVGTLPVARVMLQVTTDAIGNDLIVDERALFDQTPPAANRVICRVTRGGVDQTGLVNQNSTKIMLTTAHINIGDGFNTTTGVFQPTVAGHYAVTFQAYMSTGIDRHLLAAIRKNGVLYSLGTAQTSATLNISSRADDIVYLNGTTDYLELYVYQNTASPGTLSGSTEATFFNAVLMS
ncbi:hypothetical protein SAMN02982994_4670 [Azospirillum lipoferum]|nr:hypothetical protein SAMN02982994_4670 [Azospirillum lipoferum]